MSASRSGLSVNYAKLRSLGPALLLENKLEQATGEVRARLEALAKEIRGQSRRPHSNSSTPAVREFRSSRDPSQVYLVAFGRPFDAVLAPIFLA